jgi:hypothetical protein
VGRKKIRIERIADERNRQERPASASHHCIVESIPVPFPFLVIFSL